MAVSAIMAIMPPHRHSSVSREQTALDFDAPEPERLAHPTETVQEATPGYSTVPKSIDTAGRTRTWALHDPKGGFVAEIVTKRDATKLADILNGVLNDQRRRSR